MTSSHKSKFDFSKRRAMFVSAHKVAIYHWHKGDLTSSYMFDVNKDGKLFFERYLKETPNIPVYILIDLFEEEFKNETVPHVFGRDRIAIIDRKKSRLFRDTPFYYHKVQGREDEGRKDDIVLMSAITNPMLIQPWLDILQEHKIPIVGITSVPLLTESLIKLLPDPGDNNLIVSIQSISGLRQTFIKKDQLRVSRLVQLPRYGTEPYGPHISEEVDKIKRYLTSVRLVSADMADADSLKIYFLLNGDVLNEVKKEYKDISMAGMQFLDINDLLVSAGSDRQVSSPFADQLYIHQMLKSKASNAYARPTEKRYNSLRNTRISLLVCSAILIVASMAWSGLSFMQGVDLRQNSLSAQNKADFYQTRYELAREGLPQTPVEPAELQVAVDLVGELMGYKTTPIEMVRLISFGMNRYSNIALNNFNWVSAVDPNEKIAMAQNAPNQGMIGYSDISNPEEDYKYFQIAFIEAEVNPFDGNYRNAISLINEYAETLRTQNNVYDVSILSLPLDVSSEASMAGNTNITQREARFSIRIVLGIKNEV
jgi:hypothetical protein